MKNKQSFMQVIDDFDNLSKDSSITEEIRQYAESMKNLFIKTEETNVVFAESIRKINKEDNIVN